MQNSTSKPERRRDPRTREEMETVLRAACEAIRESTWHTAPDPLELQNVVGSLAASARLLGMPVERMMVHLMHCVGRSESGNGHPAARQYEEQMARWAIDAYYRSR
jgi:hypothetical protein